MEEAAPHGRTVSASPRARNPSDACPGRRRSAIVWLRAVVRNVKREDDVMRRRPPQRSRLTNAAGLGRALLHLWHHTARLALELDQFDRLFGHGQERIEHLLFSSANPANGVNEPC